MDSHDIVVDVYVYCSSSFFFFNFTPDIDYIYILSHLVLN